MTDANDNLPKAFHLDQEAAQAEAATRDQVTWELNVQTVRADLEMKRAHTAHTKARADLWDALQTLVWVIVVALVIVLLVLGVQHVVGWFR